MLRQFLDLLDGAAGVVAAVVVAGFTAVMLVDVFSRYILAIPLPWAPEFSILLFQMASFIGAGLALRRGLHFGLGLVLPARSLRARQAVAVFGGLVVLVSSLYLLRYGWVLTLMTKASNYPTLPFSHNVIYIGLMIGAGLMAIFALEQIGKAVFSPESLAAEQADHHAATAPKDQ